MATANSALYPTLLDLQKQKDPNGIPAQVVEMMSTSNPILQDAPVYEANGILSNRTTLRTVLPTVYTRALNEGVLPSKSGTDQVDDTLALIEGWSEIDAKIVELNGEGFRKNEDIAFTEAMAQEMARLMFLGDERDTPGEFNGMYFRYTLSSYLAAPTINTMAYQIVNGYSSASGNDQSSMWMVTWGPQSAYLAYPKGAETGGLRMKNFGSQIARDTNGKVKEVLSVRWDWNVGLVVRDPRAIVRIANCDAGISASGTDLINALIVAYNRSKIYGRGGRTVIYCNRQIKTLLEQQISGKSNIQYQPNEWTGVSDPTYLGIPIKTCDAITQGDSPLTFS